MEIFAVRQKSSGNYLPAHKPGEGGFSYDEPQPVTSRYGPRLFFTERSAQNALTAWLRGKFRRKTEQCGEFGEDISVYVEPEAVPSRSCDDMEIVRFNLVEERKVNPVIVYSTLREANEARQKLWDDKSQVTAAYRGNELAGEVGEACNVIKKLERERMGIRGSRDTVEHLAEELADIIICTDLIAMQYGIDLNKAVAAKFNKTSAAVGLPVELESA